MMLDRVSRSPADRMWDGESHVRTTPNPSHRLHRALTHRDAVSPRRLLENPMFRSILVPLDGSKFAEAAVPTAISLAEIAQGELRLVSAHTQAAAVVGMGELPVIPTEIDSDIRQRELAYLTGTAAGLGSVGGAPVAFRQVDGPA